MKGRMIHDGGREQSQLYDPDGQVRPAALIPLLVIILTDSDELVHQFARPWAAQHWITRGGCETSRHPSILPAQVKLRRL